MALPALPGFDLADALERFGGRESLLLRSLHQLAAREQATVDRIIASGADATAAGQGAHALKGLAATLGCTRLAAAAQAVEQGAKDGACDTLDLLITALAAEFASARAAIAQLPAG
jgi:HPt (histidine-containing phosphotransfer) domain-containing protein